MPIIALTMKGNSESTTKSSVAEGTITIKDKEHQKQNIAELNREMTKVGISASRAFSKDGAKTIEVVATGSMGETISIRYAEYIGNIKDNK